MDVSKWPWKKWFLSAATTTVAGGIVFSCNRDDSVVNVCNADGSDFTRRSDSSADVAADGKIVIEVDSGAPTDATDATPTDANAATAPDADATD
jgi:hypothetical protein